MAADQVRALVVEDDPAWQQILGEILSDMGLTVDTAGSLAETSASLRKHSHRLAILDLSLGGPDHLNQDGLAAADEVRRRSPNCQILFLTGFATVELAVQVMKEQGAYTCLRKEVFKRAAFRQVVDEALAVVQIDQHWQSGEQSPAQENPRVAEAEVKDYSANEEQGLALVVEDDAGWNELLSEILGEAGFSVQACRSYVEAIGCLKRSPAALAVVDLSLASSLQEHNLDGYRLLTAMRKTGIPVIVVSGYAEPARIEQAYQEGLIFACLEKQSFDRRQFLDTVNCARTQESSTLSRLTMREREVLTLLARGLTNKEIANRLTITPNTVKRHLKSLFVKLDVNTRSAASASAISLGLGDVSNK